LMVRAQQLRRVVPIERGDGDRTANRTSVVVVALEGAGEHVYNERAIVARTSAERAQHAQQEEEVVHERDWRI